MRPASQDRSRPSERDRREEACSVPAALTMHLDPVLEAQEVRDLQEQVTTIHMNESLNPRKPICHHLARDGRTRRGRPRSRRCREHRPRRHGRCRSTRTELGGAQVRHPGILPCRHESVCRRQARRHRKTRLPLHVARLASQPVTSAAGKALSNAVPPARLARARICSS